MVSGRLHFVCRHEGTATPGSTHHGSPFHSSRIPRPATRKRPPLKSSLRFDGNTTSLLPAHFFAFCSSPWLRSLLLASLACLERGERFISSCRTSWPNCFSEPVFSTK